MLELPSLISTCVFGFLLVYFGLIVDLCLVVWLGRAVSCLPRESEASRRPVTLDSPAVDKRQFKITEILFLKNKILKNWHLWFHNSKTSPIAGPSREGVFLNRRKKSRSFGLQWLFLSYRLPRIPQKIENKQRYWVLVKFPFCCRLRDV